MPPSCIADSNIPRVVSAQFSDSVTLITVWFDYATDMASSVCTELLSTATFETLGSDPACSWSDPLTLTIQLGSQPTVLVSDPVELMSGVLRSADGLSDATPSSTTPVRAPDNPPVVSALISGPANIGVCDDLRLDAGMSSGNGGRPFEFQWYVSDASNPHLINSSLLTDLNTSLALQGNVEVLWLSADNLTDDALTVMFEVKVSNWLQTTQISTLVVSKQLNALPTVSVTSPTLTLHPWNDLLVQSEAAAPSCEGGEEVQAEDWVVTYLWLQTAGPALELSDEVKTSSRLIGAPFTLQSGHVYTFEIWVTFSDPTTGLSSNNSATTSVSVVASELVASVSPGSSRFSLTQDSITLSGLASYDPDDSTGGFEELTFGWTCTRTTASTEDDDEATDCFTGANSGLQVNEAELLFYTPSDEDLDLAELTFTLTVSSGQRSTSVQVSYTFVITELPRVQISVSSPSLALFGKHNPMDTLTLVGSVEDYSLDRLSFQWSSVASSLDLSSLSAPRLLTDLTSLNLVLGSEALAAGISHTFELEVVVEGAEYLAPGWASVQVVTNAPPSSGTCSATLHNTPLTPSTLRCPDWTDDADDFPLQYQFGYLHPDTLTFFALTSYQSSPEAHVLLPVGSVELQMRVRDNKLAVATVSLSPINVPGAVSADELVSVTDVFLTDAEQALSSGDLNTFAQLAAVTLSLLNHDNSTATSVTDSTLSSSTASISTSTSSSSELENGQQIREELLNLTRALAATSTSEATSDLVVTLVASTCSEPTELNREVRLGALELLTESANTLSDFGSLGTSNAEQIVYVMNQVLSSFFVDPSSQSSSLGSESSSASSTSQEVINTAEERQSLAQANMMLALDVSKGVAAGMVAFQQVIYIYIYIAPFLFLSLSLFLFLYINSSLFQHMSHNS